MDLGFLSGLLNGQGNNNLLTMLLPLLLGGKGAGDNGITNLLSKMTAAPTADGNAFPPLFGTAGETKRNGQFDLFNALGNMLGVGSQQKPPVDQAPKYPYELQYNRP